MKNTEEKKTATAKFRFNVFDVVLILLAILCVVGIWQRSNLQSLFEAGDASDTYTVTFEIKKLRSTTAELLSDGTELYLYENGTRIPLGTLTGEPAARPASEYLYYEGNVVEARYPDDPDECLQDVTGTITCRMIEHDGAYLLGGVSRIAVNQTIAAYTESADLEIRVKSIRKAA